MRTPIEIAARSNGSGPITSRKLVRGMAACCGFVLMLLLFCTIAFSQDPAEYNAAQAQADGEKSQDSVEMQEMARAMKSMADMCQMMMQQEMKHRPLVMVAASVVGTLLTIALVLFVILEIQWIRYFGLRIKNERQRPASK